MDLVNEGTPIDVSLLDQVGLALTNNSVPNLSREEANNILIQFFERKDAYTFVIQIMEQSNVMLIKFQAMQILVKAIRQRWQVFDDNTKQMLINFLFNFLKTPGLKKQLMTPTNQAIIEIAKHDYPQRWANLFDFFSENLSSSREFCLNFFRFLSVFASDLTEEMSVSLTSLRANEMIEAFTQLIPNLFELLRSNIGDDIEMSRTAISAMKRLICIKDADVLLFSSPWLNELIQVHLGRPDLSVAVIGLLTKLISRPAICNPKYNQNYHLVLELFNTAIISLHNIVGDNFDAASELSGDDNFAEGFVSAVSSFFTNYSMVLEEQSFFPQIKQILTWIKYITNASGDDCFETCITFWLTLLRRLYGETDYALVSCPEPYSEYFHALRIILIDRMPAPLIVRSFFEADGSSHKQVTSYSQFETFYSTARQCMVFLTNFDPQDTINLVMERLNELITVNMNIDAVRSLCWAIGAIPGASPANEDVFFPKMLQTLFQICEYFQDPQERASVVEGIVFVCSQYSRFLMRFYPLFKTIVLKILMFMSQPINELQEICLECLKTLASRCHKSFSTPPSDQDSSLLDYLLENLNNIISTLLPDNIPTMYEILCLIALNINVDDQRNLIASQLITNVIERFKELLALFNPSNHDIIRAMCVVLQCHAKLPVPFGLLYFLKLQDFLPEIIPFYLSLSDAIANSVDSAALLRQLRSDIIIVFHNSIYYIYPINAIENIRVSILLEDVSKLIDDYVANHHARVPQILSFFGIFLIKFASFVTPCFKDFFTKVYVETFHMINHDINSPEFLVSFYIFVNDFCSVYISKISENEAEAEFIINSLVFGAESLNARVRDLSISITLELFGKINGTQSNTSCLSDFLQKYSMPLLLTGLQHLFNLSYKSSFQSNINFIRFFLNLPFITQQAGVVASKLCEILPNKPTEEIFNFVSRMFESAYNFNQFRCLMREFLVSSKQISIEDPDLNTVEKENLIKELNDRFRNVPGYVKDDSQTSNDETLNHLPNVLNSLSIS